MISLRRLAGIPLKRVDHRLAFLPAWLWSHFSPKSSQENRVIFVVAEQSSGWILEGICREIAKHLQVPYEFHYSLRNIPKTGIIYVSQYSLLPEIYKMNPGVWKQRVFAWYTHPNRDLPKGDMVFSLNQTERVFCTNSVFAQRLLAYGVAPEKVRVVLGGADPELFQPHRRGSGLIGMCTAYYERKQPKLMLEVMRALPDRQFLLLGRGWSECPMFPLMKALPNFRYVEAAYEEYPRYYDQMDVFLSTSRLEGGPIPVIEAMMSNVVPVVSRTGFAHDVITEGVTGFIFDLESPVDQVCQYIEKAFALKTDVRSASLDLTWKKFSERIQTYLFPAVSAKEARKESFVHPHLPVGLSKPGV